jgi:magnesium-transporting ATPase (P-type)
VKGASEMVLRTCTKFHNKKNQQIIPLDENLRNEVNKNIKKMADKGKKNGKI